jgi:hypothetical protein
MLAAACAVAAAAAMPALWLRTTDVMAALATQAHLYRTLPWSHGLFHQAVVRMEHDLPFEQPEIGWPMLALALAGVVVGLADARFRRRLVGPLLFAAALVALQFDFVFRPFRNLLPIVPLVACLAVVALDRLRERFRKSWRFDLVASAAAVAFFLPPAGEMAMRRLHRLDSRTVASYRLHKGMRPDDRLLVSADLRFVRRQLEDLPGEYVETEPARLGEAALGGGFRFLLAGAAPGSAAGDAPPTLRFGARTYRLLKSFGTDSPPADIWVWIGNSVRVDLYKLDEMARGD